MHKEENMAKKPPHKPRTVSAATKRKISLALARIKGDTTSLDPYEKKGHKPDKENKPGTGVRPARKTDDIDATTGNKVTVSKPKTRTTPKERDTTIINPTGRKAGGHRASKDYLDPAKIRTETDYTEKLETARQKYNTPKGKEKFNKSRANANAMAAKDHMNPAENRKWQRRAAYLNAMFDDFHNNTPAQEQKSEKSAPKAAPKVAIAGDGKPVDHPSHYQNGENGKIHMTDAAERMFGTGSKQHTQAIQKYGDPKTLENKNETPKKTGLGRGLSDIIKDNKTSNKNVVQKVANGEGLNVKDNPNPFKGEKTQTPAPKKQQHIPQKPQKESTHNRAVDRAVSRQEREDLKEAHRVRKELEAEQRKREAAERKAQQAAERAKKAEEQLQAEWNASAERARLTKKYNQYDDNELYDMVDGLAELQGDKAAELELANIQAELKNRVDERTNGAHPFARKGVNFRQKSEGNYNEDDRWNDPAYLASLDAQQGAYEDGFNEDDGTAFDQEKIRKPRKPRKAAVKKEAPRKAVAEPAEPAAKAETPKPVEAPTAKPANNTISNTPLDPIVVQHTRSAKARRHRRGKHA